MTLRLQAAVRGNLPELMRKEQRVVARAVTSGVRRITFGLGRALRRQIARAGFRESAQFQRAIIARTTPRRGNDINIRGRVRSKALYGRSARRRQAFDLVEAYDEGAVITARSGRWLAVPTENAEFASGRGSRRRRKTPSESDRPMQYIPTSDPNLAMLVAGERRSPRGKAVVLYWLVKTVRVRRRLDVAKAEGTWRRKLAPQIERNLDRFGGRAGLSI